jgi:hypothetical protein
LLKSMPVPERSVERLKFSDVRVSRLSLNVYELIDLL